MSGKVWLWRHWGKWGSQHGLRERHLVRRSWRPPALLTAVSHPHLQTKNHSGSERLTEVGQDTDTDHCQLQKHISKCWQLKRNSGNEENVAPGILTSHTMAMDSRPNSWTQALWCLFCWTDTLNTPVLVPSCWMDLLDTCSGAQQTVRVNENFFPPLRSYFK